MKKKTRLIATSVALVLSAIGVAAIPMQAQAKDNNVTIQFWKPPHSKQDTQFYNNLIKQFEKQNPGITVKFTSVPWASVDQQYTTAFSGSNPPDVVYMPDEWFPKFAQAGSFVDLSSRKTEIASGYTPNMLNLGSYRGHFYGVPYLVATNAFFYQPDLLKKAGVSKPPTTLADLVADASKVSKKYSAQHIFGFDDEMLSFNGVQFWYPLFASAGVKLVNPQLTKATFNTPAAQSVVNEIAKLYQSGGSVPRNKFTADQMSSLMNSGKVAMATIPDDGLTAMLQQNPHLTYGLSQGPKVKAISQWANFGFMFISSKSKAQDADWKFVKFITNKQNALAYSKTTGIFDARKDAMWWKNTPDKTVFSQAMTDTPGVLPSVHWRQIVTIIGSQIDFVIAKQETAAQALSQAEQQVNAILDGN